MPARKAMDPNNAADFIRFLAKLNPRVRQEILSLTREHGAKGKAKSEAVRRRVVARQQKRKGR